MAQWIKPFHDSDSMEYHYYSIDEITKDISVTQKVYDEGLELVQKKEAEIERADFSYQPYIGGGEEQIGLIAVRFLRSQSIKVIFAKNTLIQCTCRDYTCYYDHSGNGICKHQAAALILAVDYLKKNRPGDSTDISAYYFLQQFRRSQKPSETGMKATVHLAPRLQFSSDGVFARVQITKDGVERWYVVQNIMELFHMMERGGTYPLGKKNEISFANECVAEDSTELARMLKGWIEAKQERAHYSGYSYSEDLRNSVWLNAERLDRFFAMFNGKEIDLVENQRIVSIRLAEGNPTIALCIQKHTDGNGQFEGVSVSGNIPVLFKGGQYRYCFSDHTFYRMDDAFAEQAAPLLALGGGHGDKVEFQIGRKNLAEFYYSVLPELKKTAEITEKNTEEIEAFLPPEVSFIFYLDIDDGRPECRIGTWYGETGVAIFDLLETEILKEDFRDAHRETEVLRYVMQYFPEFHKKEERFLAADDEDTFFEIMDKAVPHLSELGEVVCTERFQSIQVRRKLKISVGVSVENELLNLEILTDDLSPLELLDILKSYRQNKKYHRLKTGEFIDLDESVEELCNMYDALHISPKEFVKGKIKLPAYRAFYLDKMLEKNQEIVAKRDSRFKQIIRSIKTVSESDYEVPDSLSHVMRGYQQFGHKWLRTVENSGFGGILADEMGLGKSLQIISVLLAEKQNGNTDPSLIVCPASLVFNWAAEFDKFAPEMRYLVIVGAQAERAELIAQYRSYDVLITSYDLIKRDITHYEECVFGFQVLDEAQYIKNHTTAAAKSVKLINAKHRFALTGTPIENRLSELWSIFDYLMPGLLYGYETFKKEFETPIVKHADESATKKMRRMTSIFILRRLKQDVLRDLPEKLEENYIVRLDEKQRHIYDAKVLELRNLLEREGEEEFQNSKLKVLAFLTQIRQICCDPALLLENYDGESAKRMACMEIVQRAIDGGHRVLVFSQFTSMLSKLEADLDALEIPYYKIIGETSKKKRVELVDSFNSGSTPVFLISLKAGGTGLNLTGADVVVHYDPWWNVAAQNQATDRAHRIGQTKAVTVYKLIAKDTIEEKIQKMQEKKQNLADSVLNGEFVNLSTMTKDELMSILI